MFEIGFTMSLAVLVYMTGLYIASIFITNTLTTNSFTIITIILAPIVACIITYLFLQQITPHTLEVPGLYPISAAALIYGISTFFIFGFDSNRHSSNTLFVVFASSVLAVVLHSVIVQMGYYEKAILYVQGVIA